MASVEGDLDEEQKENRTPLEDLDLGESPAPLNFCGLTPRHFGISAQSFTPARSSNTKDKSRLAQLKARRRSNIGVRGSPETNSLIRFMAQRKMKTPPPPQNPEPLPLQTASTLRQKMASFQHLMDVVDEQASDAGGGVKTTGYLSDGSTGDEQKENRPSAVHSGRSLVAAPQSCRLQTREAGAPVRHSSSDEEVGFELDSLRQPPPDAAAAAAAAAAPSAHLHATLPAHSELKAAGTDTDSGTRKKKSVRFGAPLLPEFFDKNLPPSTPLQRGGTPARPQTPGAALRPALKTPQRSDRTSPATPPDLDLRSAFGASPVLKMPRNRRMASVGEDEDTQIFQQTIEEVKLSGDGECWLDSQPLNLDKIFQEESEALRATEVKSEAVAEEPEQQQQLEANVEAPVQRKVSRKRRAAEGGASAAAPARSSSSSRKRKLPAESEPVKRSKRSSAAAASGKIKSSVATRRWSKDVDRSLYSSRAYASKHPVLSPITEFLSCRSPATRGADAQVTPLEAAPSAALEREASTLEVNGLLQQEVSDDSADLREEPTPAERDGEGPETRQEVQNVAAVGPPAGSGGVLQVPTTDSQSPPPRKTKRGRRSSTHRAELKLQEKELVEGAELAPWQSHFNCEDVFRPLSGEGGGGRRSVRRSLRNKDGSEGGSDLGLAWLPPSPTDPPAEARRRTRGRRSEKLPCQTVSAPFHQSISPEPNHLH